MGQKRLYSGSVINRLNSKVCSFMFQKTVKRKIETLCIKQVYTIFLYVLKESE